MGNYPTDVSINENISLYFVVNSFWNEDIAVQVRHIIGKNSTVNITSNGSNNGILISEYNRTLHVSDKWTSDEITTSFEESLGVNEHYLIIFELWVDLGLGWEFMKDQIVYIRLNVTST